MNPTSKIISAVFFKTDSGTEPVRDWLLSLDKDDRKKIGEDIKLVEFRWPLGMPTVRKMETDLWEIRTSLDKRIVRVLFTVNGAQMVLLHGFIKKDQQTPKADLDLAKTRKRDWERG
ncbi:MAG: type II toxin-antitoxin system RelE/ParE family toxin [Motiliproteus sp.]